MPTISPTCCPQTLGYVNPEYLQIAAELFTPVKEQSYQRLNVIPGNNVLDVGCGVGIDTCELARQVQPTGTVTGVDLDLAMVQQANTRIHEFDLHPFTYHLQAKASALPFSSVFFDGCRSERMFMHLSDGMSVLEEMVRVTKPHGWIVIAETDWNSLSMSSTQPDIAQTLSQVRIQHYLANGYSAQHLYGQFSTVGLRSITIDILPLQTRDIGLFRFLTKMDELEKFAISQHFLAAEEAQAWARDQNEGKEGKPFWGSVNVLIVSGQIHG